MNSMHLSGSEDVRRGGAMAREAGEQMQRAAEAFGYHVDRLIQAMDEHAARMEQLLKKDDSE